MIHWRARTLARDEMDYLEGDSAAEELRALSSNAKVLTGIKLDSKEHYAVSEAVNHMLDLADKADPVVLPEHYARFAIEPIRFICENNLNFFQGNIVKYVLRFDHKNGLEDLRKAQRYLAMFIKLVEGNPDWWRK